MAGEPWTGADVLRLRQDIGVGRRQAPDWAELARALGRSERACREKAKRLGLRQYEAARIAHLEVARRLGVTPSQISAWRKARWIRGRVGEGYSLAAVRAFLRAHPDAVDPARVDLAWLVDVLAGGTGDRKTA